MICFMNLSLFLRATNESRQISAGFQVFSWNVNGNPVAFATTGCIFQR